MTLASWAPLDFFCAKFLSVSTKYCPSTVAPSNSDRHNDSSRPFDWITFCNLYDSKTPSRKSLLTQSMQLRKRVFRLLITATVYWAPICHYLVPMVGPLRNFSGFWVENQEQGFRQARNWRHFRSVQKLFSLCFSLYIHFSFKRRNFLFFVLFHYSIDLFYAQLLFFAFFDLLRHAYLYS